MPSTAPPSSKGSYPSFVGCHRGRQHLERDPRPSCLGQNTSLEGRAIPEVPHARLGLPYLLHMNAGVLEIRRGKSLEDAYLAGKAEAEEHEDDEDEDDDED